MKVILVIIFTLILTVSSEKPPENYLINQVLCFDALQDALVEVALTMEDNFDHPLVVATLVNKINHACENILDQIHPILEPRSVRSVNSNVIKKVVAITIDCNTKNVISLRGLPERKKRYSEIDSAEDISVFCVYLTITFIDGKWDIIDIYYDVDLDTVEEVEFENETKGGSTMGVNSDTINIFDQTPDSTFIHGVPIRLKRSDNYNKDSQFAKTLLENQDDSGIKASPRFLTGLLDILFKPTCNSDEISYCNFNCESLTCENYEMENPNYLECIKKVDSNIFCLFGGWSRCECTFGLVRDLNNGMCIPPEYCPITKATTTVKPKTKKPSDVTIHTTITTNTATTHPVTTTPIPTTTHIPTTTPIPNTTPSTTPTPTTIQTPTIALSTSITKSVNSKTENLTEWCIFLENMENDIQVSDYDTRNIFSFGISLDEIHFDKNSEIFLRGRRIRINECDNSKNDVLFVKIKVSIAPPQEL